MPDPIWGGAIVALITGLVTAWVTLRSKKVEVQGSMLVQLREDREAASRERKEALEALEAARDALFAERAKTLDYERLRVDVATLQRQRESDHERIRCMEGKLSATKRILSGAVDYAHRLRAHIDQQLGPPAPDWPEDLNP